MKNAYILTMVIMREYEYTSNFVDMRLKSLWNHIDHERDYEYASNFVHIRLQSLWNHIDNEKI
jgi:hypothetical protein